MNVPAQAAEELRSITFDDLPFATFLKETIRSVGYETPTPIQAEAIPVVMEGGDLIGLAQTGTGKTAAFVLPILQKLSGRKERATRALILAPTRELAEQINDVIKMFSPRTGVKSVTVYGGVSHRNQITQLRNNPQIVVACPGRLIDHMDGGTVNLSEIEFLVLDEADRMLDMGFMPYIKQIIKALPQERQTMLFSATMPDEIAELSHSVLRNPAMVRVKSELPVASVTHSMYSLKQEEKSEALTTWLRSNAEALVVVFTKMKHTAKRLGDRLSKDGIPATALHGNLSQAQRQKALNGFRDSRFRVLIATDIASRGIDVEGVTHVLNYDMPENVEAYIHRTGRAGRASRSGDAISFVTREDRGLLRSIEKWLKAPVVRLNTDGSVDTTEVESESEERSPRGGRRSFGNRSRGQRGPRQGGERRSSGDRGTRRPARDNGDRRERSFDDTRGNREERAPRRERSFSDNRERGFDRPRRERGGDRPERGFRENRGERPFRGNREDRPFRGNGEERQFRGDRGANRRDSGREFQPRGERSFERPHRSGGARRNHRGQQDIDQKAEYVYRPEGSHFIDRTDPDAKPRRQSGGFGGRRPQGGKRPQRNGARGGRPSRSRPPRMSFTD